MNKSYCLECENYFEDEGLGICPFCGSYAWVEEA